jgi:hypothetical protein
MAYPMIIPAMCPYQQQSINRLHRNNNNDDDSVITHTKSEERGRKICDIKSDRYGVKSAGTCRPNIAIPPTCGISETYACQPNTTLGKHHGTFNVCQHHIAICTNVLHAAQSQLGYLPRVSDRGSRGGRRSIGPSQTVVLQYTHHYHRANQHHQRLFKVHDCSNLRAKYAGLRQCHACYAYDAKHVAHTVNSMARMFHRADTLNTKCNSETCHTDAVIARQCSPCNTTSESTIRFSQSVSQSVRQAANDAMKLGWVIREYCMCHSES